MDIFSPEVERHVLAGLIKYPAIFPDIATIVNEHDFFLKVHDTIFCVIRNLILGQKEPDQVVIAQTIKNMGIEFEDDINIFDYIESLSLIQINKKAVSQACVELKKLTIGRELVTTGKELIKTVKENVHLPPNELIAAADKVYNERILSYQLSEKPKNIYEDLEALVEERGNNPVDEIGIKTPYKEFNRLFGGLRDGNVYAWVSRPKHGKSTILMDMLRKIPFINNADIPCLILDTEMSTMEFQFRLAAGMCGISEWYLSTGQWRKNEELVIKVREALKLIKANKHSLEHVSVAGKPIEEILSIVRRWYYTHVGRGKRGVVCYDYIKLTGEKVTQQWAEYQVIGDKVNRLKELTIELNLPLLTACQLNRSAESGTDDSSAIAMSDRLQWFASYVAIFRRKTIDEIAADGEAYGTHKMIPLAYRFQGREGAGHLDAVKMQVKEGDKTKIVFKQNYINFAVTNFDVSERGTLKQMVEQSTSQFNIENSKGDDHEI